MKDNNGIGLLFETEGDTLSQTLKSDYGNYSDILRKAFHHEPISISRCKDREHHEIDEPQVSVVLAGTPEQVRRLIPGAEDGLFSRFCFYAIRFQRCIRDVFATTDLLQSKNIRFQMLGERFFRLQEAFVSRGSYSFHLPSQLAARFVEDLRQVNEECCDEVDNSMQGVVRRIGLTCYRIMMMLTVIRTLTADRGTAPCASGTISLTCAEEDFSTAMDICKVLLVHAVFVYRRLSGQTPRQTAAYPDKGVASRRNVLFNQLPASFSRKEYDAQAEGLGESVKTAEKWIDTFIREGRLRRTGQGEYMKLTT